MDDIINESGEPIVDWDTYMRARRELGAGFARILGYFREDGDKSVARLAANSISSAKVPSCSAPN